MYTCSAPRAASPDVDRRDGRTAPRGRRAGNAPLALVNNAKVMQRTVTTTTTRTAATGSTTTTTTTTTTATTTTSASTLGCTMTWASAKAHCESLGRRLCRASEILDASGKFIFGPMAGDHWTPVLDAENEWVQIGELMGEAGPRQARHGAQFPDKRDQGRVWICSPCVGLER